MTVAELEKILAKIDDKDTDIFSEFGFQTDDGPRYITQLIFGARRQENELVLLGIPSGATFGVQFSPATGIVVDDSAAPESSENNSGE